MNIIFKKSSGPVVLFFDVTLTFKNWSFNSFLLRLWCRFSCSSIVAVLLQQGWKLLDALLRLELRQFNGFLHLRPRCVVHGWCSTQWGYDGSIMEENYVPTWWQMYANAVFSWFPGYRHARSIPSTSRYSIRGTCFTWNPGYTDGIIHSNVGRCRGP